MAGLSASATVSKGARIIGESRNQLQDELKAKYEAGASIRTVAKTTGRSYGFIHKVLVESAVNLRGRGGANRKKSS
ncbi:MAG: helix-turn-helix domain-containing protein [Mycobacteriaceae bacterium]